MEGREKVRMGDEVIPVALWLRSARASPFSGLAGVDAFSFASSARRVPLLPGKDRVVGRRGSRGINQRGPSRACSARPHARTPGLLEGFPLRSRTRLCLQSSRPSCLGDSRARIARAKVATAVRTGGLSGRGTHSDRGARVFYSFVYYYYCDYDYRYHCYYCCCYYHHYHLSSAL